MTPNTKPPFRIAVVWHRDFEEGEDYARLIYSRFTRDIMHPLSRGIGIPVSFREIEEEKEKNRVFHLSESERSVTIILIDDRFVNCSTARDYVNMLEAQKDKLEKKNGNQKKHYLLPVALSPNALGMDQTLQKINFIRLYEIGSAQEQEDYFLIQISYTICRVLTTAANELQTGKATDSPVRLFISHARSDGVQLAEKFKMYIREKFGIRTFLDANDIYPGYDIEEVINEEIGHSILLAIHTDNFSSREWCQWEIIRAKNKNRPIILLNSLDEGESRSFPYMGNVPNIRSTTDNLSEKIANYDKLNQDKVVELLLNQVILYCAQEGIRVHYHQLFTHYICRLFEIDLQKIDHQVRSYPPELFILPKLIGQKNTNSENTNSKKPFYLVYPDPPIGEIEQAILKDTLCNFKQNGLTFTTPTELPLLDQKILHPEKLQVGISISNPEGKTISELLVQDMMVELARSLLNFGIQLAFGGKLDDPDDQKNEFNFTRLLLELVSCYTSNENGQMKNGEENHSIKIWNYNAYPYYHLIDDYSRAKYINQANFIAVPPPAFLQLEEVDYREIKDSQTHDARYVKAVCLTKMRRVMNANINARVVMGGRTTGYSGRYPGIVEEVLLAMQSGMPVFLIGGFGGAAGAIAQVLQTGKAKELTENFQFRNNQAYRSFSKFYNENDWTKESERIDYPGLMDFFGKQGKIKKNAFGLNNGLSRSDNIRLFESFDIQEIISLVLKGLCEISNRKINGSPQISQNTG